MNLIPLDHWRGLQCRLVWAYECSFVRRTIKRWDYIPSPDAAWLIKKGSVTLDFESGEERYSAGQWVFPKNAPAMQEFSEGARLVSLRFHAAWSPGLPLFERDHTLAIPVNETPELTQDAKTLVQAIDRLFPENKRIRINLKGGLAEYLIIQPLLLKCVASYYFALVGHGVVPNIPGEIDERAREALRYMETLPLDVTLHERGLARHMGLSVSQLNRIFARDLRTTPAAIWNKRKLDFACSQLIQSCFSIKQIAGGVGFSAPEHFSNWFRKHTRFSPRKYRQTYHV